VRSSGVELAKSEIQGSCFRRGRSRAAIARKVTSKWLVYSR